MNARRALERLTAAIGIALTVAGPALTAPAAAQQGPATADPRGAAPQPAQIDRNGVLILIRSALLALDHANRTGNYTVLRDLGAPGFQQANTAVRLGEVFAALRSQNLDLSGVAVLEPQLTILPQVDERGLMRMAGFFPSVPLQVTFDMVFAPVDGRWRVITLSVGLGQAAPAAPMAPAAPPVAAAPAPGATPPRPPAARPRPPAPSAPDAAPARP